MCQFLTADPVYVYKTESFSECLFKSVKSPGAQAGTMIALPVSGVLADEINWESVFYVFGALGILWFIFWAYLCHNSPASHPRIDQVQLNKHETAPNFILFNQNLTSDCLLI